MYIENRKFKITSTTPRLRASSSSLNEAKLLKVARDTKFVIEYTQKHLLRVYPAGKRVDSSNYDPVPAWNCGAQMVALNYQTGKEPVWLNQGE